MIYQEHQFLLKSIKHVPNQIVTTYEVDQKEIAYLD